MIGANVGTLGRWQAMALALSFIIGSGVLVLPILALQLAGPVGSMHAWLMMSLVGLPLVYIFYKLSLVPGFNLMTCFVDLLGNKSKFAANTTVLSALLFGMPAMIYTTAQIIAQLLSLPLYSVGPVAHAVLTALCLNHLRPVQKSTKISLVSAVFLIGLITFTGVTNLSVLNLGIQAAITNPVTFDLSLFQACTLAFFGYVGWESLSFFTSDLKHPKRDLKFVFGMSFLLVTGLYLGLSAVVSGAALSGHDFLEGDGILSLLPSGIIRTLASTATIFLLVANLNAWVLGGKNMSQDILPTRFHKKSGLLLYYLLVSILLILIESGKVSVANMFMLSNQSWIIVYGGILLYFYKNTDTKFSRVMCSLGAASFLLLASGSSSMMLANVSIFTISLLPVIKGHILRAFHFFRNRTTDFIQ